MRNDEQLHGNGYTLGRGKARAAAWRLCDPASALQRVWVLVLFTIAPLLPGYRGVRVPLAALVVALLAGWAWNTAPATLHQPMSARGPAEDTEEK